MKKKAKGTRVILLLLLALAALGLIAWLWPLIYWYQPVPRQEGAQQEQSQRSLVCRDKEEGV